MGGTFATVEKSFIGSSLPIGHEKKQFCLLNHQLRLKVKREECKVGRAWLEYLGHMLGGGKVAVPAHRLV